jgi:hypothetical protein
VALRTPLLPTEVLPKLKLDTLVFSRDVAGTPVPFTVTVLGELEAFVVMETAPDTAPLDFGANTTLNVDCRPASTDTGSESPVMERPFPAELTWLTVSFEPPLLVIVTDWETVLPTATEPKLSDPGATVIPAAEGELGLCLLEAGLEALVKPTQPELKTVAMDRSRRAARGSARLSVAFEWRARFLGPPSRSLIITILIARIVFGER